MERKLSKLTIEDISNIFKDNNTNVDEKLEMYKQLLKNNRSRDRYQKKMEENEKTLQKLNEEYEKIDQMERGELEERAEREKEQLSRKIEEQNRLQKHFQKQRDKKFHKGQELVALLVTS